MSAVVREAVASLRGQAVSTILTFLVVAGMITAVLLTSGRSIAAEQQVLSSIDQAGSRSITVRAEPDSGVTTAFLDRVASIQGVSWVGAFSQIIDGHNSDLASAPSVPLRRLYTSDPTAVGLPERPLEQTAYASPSALRLLGMPYGSGAISLTTGETIGVVPAATEVPFLVDFEPLVLMPATFTGEERVSVVVVIAERPGLVAPLTEVVGSLLSPDNPDKVAITTSRALAELRAIIETQLATFSRGLVLVLVAAASIVIGALQAGLVILRRKDFGRRRALGASRSLIVTLVLLQTLIVTLAGVAGGVGAAYALLFASGDSQPGWTFVGAVTLLTMTAALLTSLVPAVLASRREPVRELRIP